jgi:hypothetical protein
MMHAESGAATVRERKAYTEPLPNGRGSSDTVSALSTGNMNNPGSAGTLWGSRRPEQRLTNLSF